MFSSWIAARYLHAEIDEDNGVGQLFHAGAHKPPRLCWTHTQRLPSLKSSDSQLRSIANFMLPRCRESTVGAAILFGKGVQQPSEHRSESLH